MSNAEIIKWLKELKDKYLIVGAPVKYIKYIDRIIKMLEEYSTKPGDDRYHIGYRNGNGYEAGYDDGFADGTREVRD